MRDRRLTTLSALLVALMLTAIAPLTTSAAGTRFGAKLTKTTQADPFPNWCRDSNHSTKCTWVAVEAFENGDKYKAPRDGTISKVRLISCVAGSFTVQVARAKPSEDKAKIVRSGPTINYAKDNQSECGGEDGDNYKIQSFSVNFHVNKGDFIAAKGNKVGFMHSSEQWPVDQVPATAAGRRRLPGRGRRREQPAHPVRVRILTYRREPRPSRGSLLPDGLSSAGRARRGTSGALYLQSAPAGLNPLSRPAFAEADGASDVEDRVPRSGDA